MNSTRQFVSPYPASDLRESYLSADPFPHIVLDGVFPNDLMERVAEEFPSYESARNKGREFRKAKENLKVGLWNYDEFPPAAQAFCDMVSGEDFLAFLTEMTGIEKLLSDPKMVGGGLHLTAPGGRLDVHVDFNYREDFDWHRRLNLLVYFNKEWKPEWGGQLELWNEQVTVCKQVVEPLFNRCVLFETSERSFHGVRPIMPAAAGPRLSFAAYYYTEEAPEGWAGEAHSTLFKPRPGEGGLLKRVLPGLFSK